MHKDCIRIASPRLVFNELRLNNIYIYSDPEVDRIFFWRVRDLCWNYVGCRPLKKKQVVGIFRPPPGEVENW